MFDHNRAPSERTNPCGTILLASFIVSALAHYLLFGPFFRWPAFADIGDFAAHWPYIKGYLSKIGFQFQEAGDPATHIRMLGGTVADQVQFWSVIIIREILALAPGIFIAWALYTPGGRDAYRHVDGPQLYEGKMASKHAAMQYKIEVATESNDIYRQGGINLHQDVHLPFRREMQNIFITGQPGSGKSQVALPMVAEMIERGDKLIINDKKREYIEHFYDSSTGVILNPTDRRSPKWNIAADLRHELDIEQHAAQMIPDSNEPIWANGARAVYSGMLVYLLRTRGKKWGWEHLARILEADTDQLANIFR
ncbi:MAG: type IV secretion system DNA-binding domain-containing protein, partial [gamma proteobacterium symbiont of Clathrolucina costata]